MISNDSNAEMVALKNQVFTLLVALIVVSGTLTVYLYRQASLTNKDLIQAQQLSTVLTQKQASIEAFATQLANYGQRHPDFLPLLKKYGINPGAGMAPPKK
jgi:hypothetical protein